MEPKGEEMGQERHTPEQIIARAPVVLAVTIQHPTELENPPRPPEIDLDLPSVRPTAELSAQAGAVARLGSSPKRHFNANQFPDGDTGKYPVSLLERAEP